LLVHLELDDDVAHLLDVEEQQVYVELIDAVAGVVWHAHAHLAPGHRQVHGYVGVLDQLVRELGVRPRVQR
jgi:hypothetical protein